MIEMSKDVSLPRVSKMVITAVSIIVLPFITVMMIKFILFLPVLIWFMFFWDK